MNHSISASHHSRKNYHITKAYKKWLSIGVGVFHNFLMRLVKEGKLSLDAVKQTLIGVSAGGGNSTGAAGSLVALQTVASDSSPPKCKSAIFTAKDLVLIWLVTFTMILATSCTKPNHKKEDCANKVPKEGYMFQWNEETQTCEEIQLPVQKKDTVLLWNVPGSTGSGEPVGIGRPTYFQLDSIKKLPGTGNIILKLYSQDQRGPPDPILGRNADSLTVWVKDGLVTIYQRDTMLVSDEPSAEVFKKYKDLGIFIGKWEDFAKSIGGKGAKGWNGEERMGGADGKSYIPTQRELNRIGMTSEQKRAEGQAMIAQRSANWNAYPDCVTGNRKTYGKRINSKNMG